MMATDRKPGWSLISMPCRPLELDWRFAAAGWKKRLSFPADECRVTLSAMPDLPRRAADVDVERDQHGSHEDQRLSAAERPVAARAELLGDEVADHHMQAAAKDQRRHIGTERRDEHQ